MKAHYFIMKTTNEIPEIKRKVAPIYMSEMGVIAKKYKNIPIAFCFCDTFFAPVDNEKYGNWLWHKDWLKKEENVQLEFSFI